MSLITKILLSCITILILSLGFYLYSIFTNPFYSNLLSSSSQQELIDNYQSKSKEINELKIYFNSITPKDLSVEIEFADSENAMLKVSPARPHSRAYFQAWEFNPYHYQEPLPHTRQDYDPETESLAEVKARLNWTDATFREITKRLAKANCIAVRNGEPTYVSFRMSGMGRFPMKFSTIQYPIACSSITTMAVSTGCTLHR